ncbi:MAG: phosphatase PAP2 family protein [Patescibacteria group bacterium]
MTSFISALDSGFEQALYAIRDPSLVQFFIWVSELGSVATIAGLTLIALIILAYRKQWHYVLGFVVSVLGSTVATFIIKELVERPRPVSPIFAYLETSFSFPSGHATRAAAFFIFLLWVIWNFLSPMWRKVSIGVVATIILLIGFSRLYLGVHYPSDVLAGFLVGAVFVILGIKVTKILSRRLNSVGAEQSNF